MKIETVKSGVIHYHAYCEDCDWVEGMEFGVTSPEARLRKNARMHVKSTGHTVSVESGTITTYSPSDAK